ncbi:hypothetical protein PIB30_094340 [Stylosanthes scabra]|uniref:RNase H type-1 domain-containing protein n=1 Tax=Stylosanthes scabra TaxID=79078 RepID=A0ABU6QW61_9FABA|nr:hypothetical protein [Stylosanthes scabra]
MKSNNDIWEIDSILWDIREIKSTIDGFTWVPREGNNLAQLIAKHKKNDALPPNRSYYPPPSILMQIQIDKTPQSRRMRPWYLLQNRDEEVVIKLLLAYDLQKPSYRS